MTYVIQKAQLHKCTLYDQSLTVSYYSVTMTIILGTVCHLVLSRHSVLETGSVTVISCKCSWVSNRNNGQALK